MTRQEEIIEASKEYSLNRFNIRPDVVQDCFIAGAKWADKHPKQYNQEELCDIQSEMMKQRDARLIKKACDWVESCAAVVVREFKKAMEE